MLPLSETYKPSKNCRIIHISRCRKLSIQRCVPFGYPCSLPGRFVGYRPHFAKRPPRNFHRVVAHPFDFSIFPRLRLVAWPLFGRSSHQGSCCVEAQISPRFPPVLHTQKCPYGPTYRMSTSNRPVSEFFSILTFMGKWA